MDADSENKFFIIKVANARGFGFSSLLSGLELTGCFTSVSMCPYYNSSRTYSGFYCRMGFASWCPENGDEFITEFIDLNGYSLLRLVYDKKNNKITVTGDDNYENIYVTIKCFNI